MTHTHQYLIDSLEQALPTLRDVEQIAAYLVQLKTHDPLAFSINERIQTLYKTLAALATANDSCACLSLAAAK